MAMRLQELAAVEVMMPMRTILMLAMLQAAVIAVPVAAQTTSPQDKPTQPETRSTGLPEGVTWKFNFDAGWGTFGFANSLYDNPKEPVDEALSDQWFEGYVKPALSGSYVTGSAGVIYGKVSVVGERTYGSVPAEFGADVSSFGPEDLYIGWRSGDSLTIGENALDLTVGRARYRLGHGFLLFDGAAEGGSRGGYWTNARQAFEFAAIARLQPAHHKVELFYLDKDELEDADSGSRLYGGNYELTFGADDSTTLGATYMKWMAHEDIRPGRDGLNVFNLRAYTAPVPNFPDLTFEFEYATERNGDALEADAWTIQGAYELSGVTWTPTFTYRYAFFEGDDPQTVENENFDPLFLGFYDWGSWWQGEIGGEYFLSNSNMVSNLIRAHVSPSESIGVGVLIFKFTLDQPQALNPAVTSKDIAIETDLYMDWKVNANFTVSVIGAYANPGLAVEQNSGRTKNFSYGMVYVGYSF
jgi:Alginate export